MRALPAGIFQWRGGYTFELNTVERSEHGPSPRRRFASPEAAMQARVALLQGTLSHGTSFTEAVRRYTLDGHDTPYHRALCLMAEHWGTKPLDSLTLQDLKSYMAWRATQYRRPGAGRTVSGATINRDITSKLAGLLSWAMDPNQGKLLPPTWDNPIKYYRKLLRRPELFKRQAISAARLDELAAHFPEGELRIALRLAFLTGLRKGNLLPEGQKKPGLQWEQIDWETIPPKLTYRSAKGRGGLKDFTKGLSPEIIALLDTLGRKPSGPVFTRATYATFYRWFKRARAAIGLPRLRIHDLRVLYATTLAERGVHIKAIQKAIGHAGPAMTLHYIEAHEERDVWAAVTP